MIQTLPAAAPTSGKLPKPVAGGGGGVATTNGAVPRVAEKTKAVRAMNDLTEADAVRVLSPEEKKRLDFQSKFHPSVLALIDRLKNKTAATLDESKFVRSGKAEIQIWFTDKSEEAMAKLKELGFEVVLDPKTAKMVIGRIQIEKLSALGEIKSIRYVAPQISGN